MKLSDFLQKEATAESKKGYPAGYPFQNSIMKTI